MGEELTVQVHNDLLRGFVAHPVAHGSIREGVRDRLESP
jgi:hypothetical protein